MKLKQLTFAAMLSALLFVVIVLDARFSYLFTQYFGYLFALPIIVLGVYTHPKSAFVSVVSVCVLLLMSGQWLSLFYVAPILMLGLLIQFLIRKRIDFLKFVGYIGLFNLLIVLIQYYILSFIFKIEADIIQETTMLLASFQISKHTIELVAYIILFAISLLQVIIILLMFTFISRKFYQKDVTYFDIEAIQVHPIFGIVSTFMLLFYSNMHHFSASSFIQTITLLVLALQIVINIFVGGSVMVVYLKKIKQSKWIGVIPILCCIPGIVHLVMFLGIGDSIFKIKRRLR